MRTLTARDADEDIAAAGYVLAPVGRYVDEAYGIDWAVIEWGCPACGAQRPCPGPGEPPVCCERAMQPVRA